MELMLTNQEKWLQEDFCVYNRNSRWQPRDISCSSLTVIPTYIINTCLSFLSDEDLLRSSHTCSIFWRAYYKLYRATNKRTVEDFRGIIDVTKLGYVFSSITYLNITLPYNSFDFKYLSHHQFPALESLKLNYVCVNSLPINRNIKFLSLIGCTFFGKRKRKKAKQFPFFNVNVLEIDRGSKLSEDCPLPRLLKLQKLKIRETHLSHPLTRRRFPRLVCLELRGIDTVQNCPNIQAPKVKKLTIDHPEHLRINRDNQFYYIIKLKIFKSDASFDDVGIMRRLDGRYFPRLECLELEYGIGWYDCNLSYLPPHPTLQSLRVNSRGSIDPSIITNDHFPSLKRLILNTDHVDLTNLPPHNAIEDIMVPPSTDCSRLLKGLDSWPKLTNCGYFDLPDKPIRLESYFHSLPSAMSSISQLVKIEDGEEKLFVF